MNEQPQLESAGVASKKRAHAPDAVTLLPGNAHFEDTECGAGGDCAACAYLAVATAMAAHSKSTPKPQDLAAKGRLQGYLRCQAETSCGSSLKSALTLAHACPSGVEGFAKDTSTAGVWANAVSLHALACSLHCQFRIWTWSSQLSKWLLYIVGPPRARKQKNCTNPAVIWLRLCNQHYTPGLRQRLGS